MGPREERVPWTRVLRPLLGRDRHELTEHGRELGEDVLPVRRRGHVARPRRRHERDGDRNVVWSQQQRQVDPSPPVPRCWSVPKDGVLGVAPV